MQATARQLENCTRRQNRSLVANVNLQTVKMTVQVERKLLQVFVWNLLLITSFKALPVFLIFRFYVTISSLHLLTIYTAFVAACAAYDCWFYIYITLTGTAATTTTVSLYKLAAVTMYPLCSIRNSCIALAWMPNSVSNDFSIVIVRQWNV